METLLEVGFTKFPSRLEQGVQRGSGQSDWIGEKKKPLAEKTLLKLHRAQLKPDSLDITSSDSWSFCYIALTTDIQTSG